jgi:hypothetical protein
MRGNFGTNDDMASIGRAMVEQLAAIRKQLAASATAAAGNVTVTAGIATGAATVDIGLPASAAVITLDMLISPTTDGSDVRMQVGAGGSIFSGAADYSYATVKGTTQSVSTGAAFGLIMPAADSLSSQVRMVIYRPGEAVRHIATWSGLLLDSAASSPNALTGGCRFLNNTNPIDTLRLLASAGNLTVNYTLTATAVQT